MHSPRVAGQPYAAWPLLAEAATRKVSVGRNAGFPTACLRPRLQKGKRPEGVTEIYSPTCEMEFRFKAFTASAWMLPPALLLMARCGAPNYVSGSEPRHACPQVLYLE